MTYAIVRYHVLAGVDWSHFPLYIANKGASLAAVFFIASSYLIGKICESTKAIRRSDWSSSSSAA